jgi:ATP-dependent DNA helicase RecG
MRPLPESSFLRLLDELRALPTETEWVEFKEAKRDFDSRKLGKYVSALAIEACLAGRPYGWLVFGVRNEDHSVVGTSYRNDPAKLQGLKHELAQQLTGGFTVQGIYEADHPNGRALIFEIPSTPAGIPIAYQGHWYGRDGESLVPLRVIKFERRSCLMPSKKNRKFTRSETSYKGCEERARSTMPGLARNPNGFCLNETIWRRNDVSQQNGMG